MPRYPGVRQKGKRWYFRVQYKHDRREYGPFDTAEDAYHARIDHLKQLRDRKSRPQNLTVEQLCIKYLEEHEKVYNRYSTLLKSEGICRNHIIPVLGKRRIGDLTPNEMRLFQKHLIQEKAPTVASNTMKTLKKILNWAVEWELLPSNPVRGKLPARPQAEHPTLEPEQLKTLMREIPLREKIVVGLGIFAGLRIGEIFGLQWEDIDFSDNTLHIRRQYSSGILGPVKTETSKSVIPLWEPFAALLKLWRLKCGSPTWLFKKDAGDQPMMPEYWRKRYWRDIKRQFDLPGNLRFHDLRHSFATILLSRGADKGDVQQLMRHRSIKVTMDIYRHLLPRHLSRALEFFDALGGEKNGPSFTQFIE